MITRFTAAAVAAAACTLTIAQNTLAAEADSFRVLHHERLATFALDRRSGALDAMRNGGRATRLRFEALGRAFDVGLEPNERLLANLAAGDPTLRRLELYRGSLTGQPHTWVRVGMLDGELYALLWDGAELYVVEPAARLRGHLQDGDERGRGPVIFRLSDIHTALRDEVLKPAAAGSSYAALISDLRAATATAGADLRLDLGLVADTEFAASHPDVEAELLLRANYVDGIFSEQLGVQINVVQTQWPHGAPDSFSSSDPTTLLASVSDYRERTVSLRSTALVHLYTGRELDGDVVGIAYMNGLCDPKAGVGLTQSGSSVFHDSLITAHELGHNVGAPHDAESGSPCEDTPPDYLMSAQLNGSDRFSQCSIDRIETMLARADCLGPAFAGDVRVTLASEPSTLLGDDMDLRVSVDNLGDEPNANVVIEFTASLATVGAVASAAGHDCAIVDGGVRCALGSFEGGAHDDIDIVLTSTRTGIANLQATAFASNDTNPANNLVMSALAIEPAVILDVDVAPETLDLGPGDAAPITITLVNDSTMMATGVSVELSSPFELTDLQYPGGACTSMAGEAPRFRCDIGTLRSRDSGALRAVVHAPAVVGEDDVVSGLLVATASAAEPLARAGQNSATGVVRAWSAVVDLDARVESAPSVVAAGERGQLVVVLSNRGPDAASAATLDIEFPEEIAVKRAADDHAACALSGGHAVHCALDTLANGEAVEVSIEIAAERSGTYSWTIAATHTGFDPDAANDGSRQSLEVSATAAPPSRPAANGNGGGGGGACWFLLGIAGIGLARRRMDDRVSGPDGH